MTGKFVMCLTRALSSRLLKKDLVLSSHISSEAWVHDSKSIEAGVVSIIVPTRDLYEVLKLCLDGIMTLTKYPNFEIIVVDNGSVEEDALRYISSLSQRDVLVISAPGSFNYSALINIGAAAAQGEFLCLLNNDVLIEDAHWLTYLTDHFRDPLVGVVGTHLLYPSGEAQHVGVALGLNGVAGHPGIKRDYSAVLRKELRGLECYQNSATTFACAVLRRTAFAMVGGLNEDLPVGFNDVDYCLKNTEIGFLTHICGRNHSTHLESATRGKKSKFTQIIQAGWDNVYMIWRWRNSLSTDKYWIQKSSELKS